MIFVLLRAFANGGASLTGIEAVSDAVGAFRPPEGRNARKVLMTEGAILGTLVAGISWLAHTTHATPRTAGYPTVLAQEAQIIFGHTFIGQALFFVIQGATMLILYTGANTSFNGFPFLTSYVAGDSFLPRWLLKRGHRLVFSNAIILLTIVSSALLIIKDADVNKLVPLYAIGVFTAFSMAGFGMAKYHTKHRGPGWRRKLIINFSAGVLTLTVVAIFAVVKFAEGAWVVVVLFAVLVPALIRMNREYAAETEVLDTITENQPPPPPHYSRRTVFVFVDNFDLATLAALRYARSMRPTTIRAVHFVIDSVRADKLREKWTRADRGVTLDFIDVADRRLPGGRRTGRARSNRSRHARDRGAAAAELLSAARPAAARPYRRQDRGGGQPHPAIRRDDHPLRRREPRPGPPGTPGRQGRDRQRRRRADRVRRGGSGGQAQPGRQDRAAQGSPAPVHGRVTGRQPAEANGPVADESGVSPIGEIAGRAGPSSKGGSAWWRSSRWNATPCWPARSPTDPATSRRCSTAARTSRASCAGPGSACAARSASGPTASRS